MWEYMVDSSDCSLILMAYFVPTSIYECQNTWHVWKENKPDTHASSDIWLIRLWIFMWKKFRLIYVKNMSNVKCKYLQNVNNFILSKFI